MQHVYDRIVAAGEAVGLMHAGYHALNSLRLEKAYRHWSHDITDEDSPLEAGLGFVIKFDKPGGFIGREALLAQQEQGIARHLVQLKLNDPEPLIITRPIWRGDEIVGHHVRSPWAHLGGAVGLGYVTAELGARQTAWAIPEVEVARERFPADLSRGARPGNVIRCWIGYFRRFGPDLRSLNESGTWRGFRRRLAMCAHIVASRWSPVRWHFRCHRRRRLPTQG